MNSTTKYSIYLGITIATYFMASKRVFDLVYATSDVIIDELFHIPQGMQFCNRNLTYWDPKITTLPGLYMLTTVFPALFFNCDTYHIRLLNLVASVMNLMLISSILTFTYGNKEPVKTVLQALSIAILPPLYFFSHVYYTDTLSLTFLLLYSRICFMGNYKISLLTIGLWCVIMRQTNVVWVALVLGHRVLDLLIRTSRVFNNTYLSKVNLRGPSTIANNIDNSKLKRYYSLADVYIAVKYHCSTRFSNFIRYTTFQDWLAILTHAFILLSFTIFVIWNGGIVVGDKKAHEATIHITQMFYYLIFYGVFGLPWVINKFITTFRLIFGNKLIVIILIGIFLATVHFNTIVHPYLLADNRHYTFYIWNRWYGKYDFAKYVSVPVYVFLLVNLYANLKEQNCISFLLPYMICLFAALSLQRMIEVRYFLIPYIIMRLRFPKPSMWIVLSELVWYLILNFVSFYMFFTKVIVWKDFDYPQRLIW